MVAVIPLNSMSVIVTAAIASTTTTALGTITGSCLPLISISVCSPDLVTLLCLAATDGVGLNAALSGLTI